MRPTIFIASSSEQLSVANTIAEDLKDPERWNVTVWTEAFAFSAAFIESLEDQLDRADFAIVVLTGHDPADVRGSTVVLPRDNALFELGLFIGQLGRSRYAMTRRNTACPRRLKTSRRSSIRAPDPCSSSVTRTEAWRHSKRRS